MTIKPPHLEPGDLVRIVAPASHFERKRFDAGVRVLEEQLGLRVTWRDDVFAQHRFLAGDDARRADELMEAFRDDECKAVWCARGGYGSTRILGRLDPQVFRDQPKVFIGFSDITAALNWIHREAGLVTFHGPMVTGRMSEGLSDGDRDALERTLMRAEPPGVVGGGRVLVEGDARGRLIGGSLAMLAAIVGTPHQPDTDGAILFLEDVGEKPYRIDRMLRQLQQAGLFEGVVGLAVGELVGCESPQDPDNGPAEIISDFAHELELPCVIGLPFGHGEDNRIVPIGVGAELVDGSLTITEAAVL